MNFIVKDVDFASTFTQFLMQLIDFLFEMIL